MTGALKRQKAGGPRFRGSSHSRVHTHHLEGNETAGSRLIFLTPVPGQTLQQFFFPILTKAFLFHLFDLKIFLYTDTILNFTCGSMVKNLPARRDTWVRSLGWEDPLEKGMGTQSSILAWRIPWTEEPGGLQSVGSQRIGHDRVMTMSNMYPQADPFSGHQEVLLYMRAGRTTLEDAQQI